MSSASIRHSPGSSWAPQTTRTRGAAQVDGGQVSAVADVPAARDGRSPAGAAATAGVDNRGLHRRYPTLSQAPRTMGSQQYAQQGGYGTDHDGDHVEPAVLAAIAHEDIPLTWLSARFVDPALERAYQEYVDPVAVLSRPALHHVRTPRSCCVRTASFLECGTWARHVHVPGLGAKLLRLGLLYITLCVVSLAALMASSREFVVSRQHAVALVCLFLLTCACAACMARHALCGWWRPAKVFPADHPATVARVPAQRMESSDEEYADLRREQHAMLAFSEDGDVAGQYDAPHVRSPEHDEHTASDSRNLLVSKALPCCCPRQHWSATSLVGALRATVRIRQLDAFATMCCAAVACLLSTAIPFSSLVTGTDAAAVAPTLSEARMRIGTSTPGADAVLYVLHSMLPSACVLAACVARLPVTPVVIHVAWLLLWTTSIALAFLLDDHMMFMGTASIVMAGGINVFLAALTLLHAYNRERAHRQLFVSTCVARIMVRAKASVRVQGDLGMHDIAASIAESPGLSMADVRARAESVRMASAYSSQGQAAVAARAHGSLVSELLQRALHAHFPQRVRYQQLRLRNICAGSHAAVGGTNPLPIVELHATGQHFSLDLVSLDAGQWLALPSRPHAPVLVALPIDAMICGTACRTVLLGPSWNEPRVLRAVRGKRSTVPSRVSGVMSLSGDTVTSNGSAAVAKLVMPAGSRVSVSCTALVDDSIAPRSQRTLRGFWAPAANQAAPSLLCVLAETRSWCFDVSVVFLPPAGRPPSPARSFMELLCGCVTSRGSGGNDELMIRAVARAVLRHCFDMQSGVLHGWVCPVALHVDAHAAQHHPSSAHDVQPGELHGSFFVCPGLPATLSRLLTDAGDADAWLVLCIASLLSAVRAAHAAVSSRGAQQVATQPMAQLLQALLSFACVRPARAHAAPRYMHQELCNALSMATSCAMMAQVTPKTSSPTLSSRGKRSSPLVDARTLSRRQRSVEPGTAVPPLEAPAPPSPSPVARSAPAERGNRRSQLPHSTRREPETGPVVNSARASVVQPPPTAPDDDLEAVVGSTFRFARAFAATMPATCTYDDVYACSIMIVLAAALPPSVRAECLASPLRVEVALACAVRLVCELIMFQWSQVRDVPWQAAVPTLLQPGVWALRDRRGFAGTLHAVARRVLEKCAGDDAAHDDDTTALIVQLATGLRGSYSMTVSGGDASAQEASWSSAGAWALALHAADTFSLLLRGGELHTPGSLSDVASNVDASASAPLLVAPIHGVLLPPQILLACKRTHWDDRIAPDRIDPALLAAATQANLIEPDDLSLDELIGKGTFGDVFRAWWRHTPVAVKLFDHECARRGERAFMDAMLRREAGLLCTLRHPNVVAYVGVCMSPRFTGIVMDYMERGTVKAALHTPASRKRKPTDRDAGQHRVTVATGSSAVTVRSQRVRVLRGRGPSPEPSALHRAVQLSSSEDTQNDEDAELLLMTQWQDAIWPQLATPPPKAPPPLAHPEPIQLAPAPALRTPGALDDVDVLPPALTLRQRLHILAEVARGLHYLHSAKPWPIVHRDIKPDNVFIGRSWNIVLGDFGFARMLSAAHDLPVVLRGGLPAGAADVLPSLLPPMSALTRCGSLMYSAPELIIGKPHNEKADVYAFGIMIAEMLATRKPSQLLAAARHASMEKPRAGDATPPDSCRFPVVENMTGSSGPGAGERGRERERGSVRELVAALSPQSQAIAEQIVAHDARPDVSLVDAALLVDWKAIAHVAAGVADADRLQAACDAQLWRIRCMQVLAAACWRKDPVERPELRTVLQVLEGLLSKEPLGHGTSRATSEAATWVMSVLAPDRSSRQPTARSRGLASTHAASAESTIRASSASAHADTRQRALRSRSRSQARLRHFFPTVGATPSSRMRSAAVSSESTGRTGSRLARLAMVSMSEDVAASPATASRSPRKLAPHELKTPGLQAGGADATADQTAAVEALAVSATTQPTYIEEDVEPPGELPPLRKQGSLLGLFTGMRSPLNALRNVASALGFGTWGDSVEVAAGAVSSPAAEAPTHGAARRTLSAPAPSLASSLAAAGTSENTGATPASIATSSRSSAQYSGGAASNGSATRRLTPAASAAVDGGASNAGTSGPRMLLRDARPPISTLATSTVSAALPARVRPGAAMRAFRALQLATAEDAAHRSSTSSESSTHTSGRPAGSPKSTAYNSPTSPTTLAHATVETAAKAPGHGTPGPPLASIPETRSVQAPRHHLRPSLGSAQLSLSDADTSDAYSPARNRSSSSTSMGFGATGPIPETVTSAAAAALVSDPARDSRLQARVTRGAEAASSSSEHAVLGAAQLPACVVGMTWENQDDIACGAELLGLATSVLGLLRECVGDTTLLQGLDVRTGVDSSEPFRIREAGVVPPDPTHAADGVPALESVYEWLTMTYHAVPWSPAACVLASIYASRVVGECRRRLRRSGDVRALPPSKALQVARTVIPFCSFTWQRVAFACLLLAQRVVERSVLETSTNFASCHLLLQAGSDDDASTAVDASTSAATADNEGSVARRTMIVRTLLGHLTTSLLRLIRCKASVNLPLFNAVHEEYQLALSRTFPGQPLIMQLRAVDAVLARAIVLNSGRLQADAVAVLRAHQGRSKAPLGRGRFTRAAASDRHDSLRYAAFDVSERATEGSAEDDSSSSEDPRA